MAIDVTSLDVRAKKPSETRHVLVDFQNALDKDDAVDEAITSVLGVSAIGLSTSGEAITTLARRINGRVCPPGKAISFTVSGGTDGNDYEIIVQVQTSGGQIIDRSLTLQVRAG